MSEDKNNEYANRRPSDMILAPNEYAFISDETKGDVSVFVGPNKTSLAGTDKCVIFDYTKKRFIACQLDKGIQTFQTAPEGWYVVLKNPAEQDKHPGGSGKLSTPTLRVGKKVNIPGPATFALWPGQMAKVVQGHNLKSNEYLLVRVYDEEAAKANLSRMVIRSVDTSNSQPVVSNDDPDQTKTDAKNKNEAPKQKEIDQNPINADNLSMGKMFVIRGTEVSFYIPPTGIEVVPEKVNGEERYVREAVSLERLEYCLLLDQDGTKRYVHGPDVVFPKPTEKFVEAPIKSNPDRAKAKKFRAQELTPSSGIHIRVIADYEEGGVKYRAGDELFITGKEQTIYFPREEHAIIKYGEQEIHYGIAIPSGEARYVLDRTGGYISLVKGPQIFLPDPRHQVIAQRALPLSLCSLLYPNNKEALDINAERLGVVDQDFVGAAGGANSMLANYDESTYIQNYAAAAVATPDTNRRIMIRGASKSLPGDAFDRKNKFTAPRSVVLNTKYDGAVTIDVWTGYAMLLVKKSGERRVVKGPVTAMLEYDESPQVMTLSRGKPKTMDNPFQTVYLKTTANKVSDIVTVETKDYIKLDIKLSYRVNFEGNDPETWFNVDNYVKFLTDHMRSKIRSAVQKLGIEEFYNNHTELLRNTILGVQAEGKSRIGTLFAENNMRIYDVEVLDVKILNGDVEKLLVQAQRDVISNTLRLATERRTLEFTIESEDIKRRVEDAKTLTLRQNMETQAENAKLRLILDLAQIEAAAKAEQERIANEFESAKARSNLSDIERVNNAKNEEQRIEFLKQAQEVELEKLRRQTEALVEKAKAVSPEFIAALQAFGDKALVERVSEAMAPMALLGGGSVVDVLKKLLEGTPLANVIDTSKVKAATNGNGKQLNG